MKRAILLSVICMSCVLIAAADEVTVVERPTLGSAAYRAPLHGGYLRKLPVGQVQPKGWLLEYLNRQRAGLNGQLGSVSDWLDKQGNQWLSDTGSHGWEEVPYWLRGYSSLAYILDDETMKQEAQVWFDAVLSHLKANGELGPSGTDGDPDTPDLWAKMPMLWALQTYYEHSGDERVLTAMTDYFKWELTIPDDHFLKGLWQGKRGGDNEWSVLWLYNLTGDESILQLIDKLHRCGVDWTMPNDLPNWHGVNVAQGFREPATTFALTGERRLLDATYENFNTMRRRYGQVPGGMFGADENARTGYFDPRQGTETCALVEQMASDEMLMSLTGDPFWADHCEDVALNSFTAALMPDMRSLRYLTAPNMAVSDEKLHGPSIDNNLRGMLSMSPFSSRCCQHNHGMGWPYYAEHLVMATADGGLATMLYAANETRTLVADGREVVLVEETHYPFEEQVNFTLRSASPVQFPFYLRIPAWAEGAQVTVNDVPVSMTATSGRYVRILREWRNGDRIGLTLPMQVTSRVWAQNKSSVSINYGPLTLSLKIDTEAEPHDSRDPEFNQDDSHWQQGVDASLWPCYVLKPKSDWNYALKVDAHNLPVGLTVTRKPWPADDFPFTLESVPLEFSATGRQIPSWGLDDTGMTDQLPTKFAPMSETETPLTLVPMGAARLRISAFPAFSLEKRERGPLPVEPQPQDTHATAEQYIPEGYKLVWHDEFSTGPALNAADWTYEVQGPGWVNQELQTYVAHISPQGRPVTQIVDGKLLIHCFREGDAIYSGRVKAREAVGWKYGIVEARLKLPRGKGTWPAFWMMPSDVDWSREGWPRCGEIDIMEEVGTHANYVSSSLHAEGHNHVNGTQVTHEMLCEGAEDVFHVYRLEWTPDRITTYVDGHLQLTYDNPHDSDDPARNWPYDRPYYVILNLAWGGTWGGMNGVDERALPATYEIDYVRVYQKMK